MWKTKADPLNISFKPTFPFPFSLGNWVGNLTRPDVLVENPTEYMRDWDLVEGVFSVLVSAYQSQRHLNVLLETSVLNFCQALLPEKRKRRTQDGTWWLHFFPQKNSP